MKGVWWVVPSAKCTETKTFQAFRNLENLFSTASNTSENVEKECLSYLQLRSWVYVYDTWLVTRGSAWSNLAVRNSQALQKNAKYRWSMITASFILCVTMDWSNCTTTLKKMATWVRTRSNHNPTALQRIKLFSRRGAQHCGRRPEELMQMAY